MLAILLRVGFVIVSAIREEARRKSSVRKVEDSRFGTLTGELDVWSGAISEGGKEIQFYIGGSEEAPDERLLDALSHVLEQLGIFQEKALQFLLKENPSSTPLHFEFASVDLLYPDDPDQFSLNYELEGDEEGIWRVEFEKGEPVFSGRDD